MRQKVASLKMRHHQARNDVTVSADAPTLTRFYG
jgi:hypothetical protein